MCVRGGGGWLLMGQCRQTDILAYILTCLHTYLHAAVTAMPLAVGQF
jgi:hypothetical protein